jgi:hypothetical protein
MRDLCDALTGSVRGAILRARAKHAHGQTELRSRTRLPEVEDAGHVDLGGHKQARREMLGKCGSIGEVQGGVDQMPVRLDGNGSSRLT